MPCYTITKCLSKLIQKIAGRFEIKRVKITAFHPPSNGSLERSHHAVGEFSEQYSEKVCQWNQWVEIAILNYNTCVREGTKHTPFEVVFGRLTRSPSNEPLREDDLQPTYQNYIKDLVIRLIGIRTTVYNNLVDAKRRSKNYYDKTLNGINFRVGDYVFFY